MLTASEILSSAHIVLKTFKHGNQKSLCPQCSHTRKKKRDPCLSVEISDRGVRWHCHNCSFQGGEFYDQSDAWQRDRPMARKPENLRGNSRPLSRLYR